jgi:DNA-binding GntR family transcriptional regulator
LASTRTQVAIVGAGEDAALLEIPPRTPLLVETRVVYDTANTPIEHTETRYSPTRYIFDIELHRPGMASAQ